MRAPRESSSLCSNRRTALRAQWGKVHGTKTTGRAKSARQESTDRRRSQCVHAASLANTNRMQARRLAWRALWGSSSQQAAARISSSAARRVPKACTREQGARPAPRAREGGTSQIPAALHALLVSRGGTKTPSVARAISLAARSVQLVSTLVGAGRLQSVPTVRWGNSSRAVGRISA